MGNKSAVTNESLKRPTWAEIDLSSLESNYRHLCSLSPNSSMCAMVKANAYGHGVVPVARKLQSCGVKAFGVATVEEGEELRENGIETQILVFGGLLGLGEKAAIALVKSNLTPVVHSSAVLEALSKSAGDKDVKIHLKIDTGMGRLGLRTESLKEFFGKLNEYKNISIEGVLTHLALADDEEYSNFQLDKFVEAKKVIQECCSGSKIWHYTNSTWLREHSNNVSLDGTKSWIRPGLSLYGVGPEPLKQIMSLKSQLALIKHIPKGDFVSYGCTWKAKRPSKIGVIPIGYADGYPWACSNKSEVLIQGQRVPQIGRVTMDMIVVDITDVKTAKIGDVVTLMGRDGQEEITAKELARNSGTISYEIISLISPRVPRKYVDFSENGAKS